MRVYYPEKDKELEVNPIIQSMTIHLGSYIEKKFQEESRNMKDVLGVEGSLVKDESLILPPAVSTRLNDSEYDATFDDLPAYQTWNKGYRCISSEGKMSGYLRVSAKINKDKIVEESQINDML